MKSKETASFVCFLIASICFFIAAFFGITNQDGNSWVTNLCLGATFLCLAGTHLKKSSEDRQSPKEQNQ